MNTETKPFLDYIHALEKELAAGNATEHTHRPALKTLLEAGSTGVPLVEKGPGAGSACESSNGGTPSPSFLLLKLPSKTHPPF